MSKISTVRQEKVEDIAEELEWELELQESSGEEEEYINENLKAMLNYYIEEDSNYVVTGAVISCDQMSDKPLYIKREGNRIEIIGEMGKKVFQTSKGGMKQSEHYEAHTDAKGSRRLYAVHATDQTTGGRTFATVRDCICLRDKEEGKKRGLPSIISLGNCKLMEKTDAEEIEKRKKDAQKYGTCYCLIKPDDKWVNPYCMESVIGECHENNGGLNSVLPTIGAADILTPRPACKRIEHHSTMKWSTDIGLEEGITMLSTLLCTRGGIITVEKSGQVSNREKAEIAKALTVIEQWKLKNGVSIEMAHNAIAVLEQCMSSEELMTKVTVDERLWIDLRYYGYSEIATAGILGNMAVESEGFQLDCLQGDRTQPETGYGMGLCQWSDSSRQKGLYDMADEMGMEWYHYEPQFAYLIKEIEEFNDFKEVRVGEMNKFTDIANATKIFMNVYEKAGILHEDWRCQAAEDCYLKFHEE